MVLHMPPHAVWTARGSPQDTSQPPGTRPAPPPVTHPTPFAPRTFFTDATGTRTLASNPLSVARGVSRDLSPWPPLAESTNTHSTPVLMRLLHKLEACATAQGDPGTHIGAQQGVCVRVGNRALCRATTRDFSAWPACSPPATDAHTNTIMEARRKLTQPVPQRHRVMARGPKARPGCLMGRPQPQERVHRNQHPSIEQGPPWRTLRDGRRLHWCWGTLWAPRRHAHTCLPS